MELLVETDLLEIFAPELARGLRPGASAADGEGPAAEEAAKRRARLWAYLGALDRSTERRPTPPSNALILAALLLPPLRDALDPSTRGVPNVGQLIAESIAPALERLRPSRRDSDLARQILLSLRFMLPGGNRQRRHELRGREVYDDAARLVEIVGDAAGLEPALAVPTAVPDAPAGAEGAPGRARSRPRTAACRPSSTPSTPRAAAGGAAAAARAASATRPVRAAAPRPTPSHARAAPCPRPRPSPSTSTASSPRRAPSSAAPPAPPSWAAAPSAAPGPAASSSRRIACLSGLPPSRREPCSACSPTRRR
jgi:hypothetical protein